MKEAKSIKLGENSREDILPIQPLVPQVGLGGSRNLLVTLKANESKPLQDNHMRKTTKSRRLEGVSSGSSRLGPDGFDGKLPAPYEVRSLSLPK